LSVFRATGIRLAELAGIRFVPDDPGRSDLDLEHREIRVRGKGGKDRTVRIDHEAARRVDRYLRSGRGTRRHAGWGCGSGPAAGGR
jgi:site-specific recombinase XerD